MPRRRCLPSAMPDFPLPGAAALAPLAEAAARADELGGLQPGQLDLLHREGWLTLLAPRAVGGGEWPLPAIVRLEEAVAAADGSCGWFLTLCAGAGWFAGFLPPELARDILAAPRVCLAGSGAAGGWADRDGDGWRISGHWGHATGAPQASHFTFNARLREQGRPLLDALGQPRVRAFVVPARDVQWQPSWHSIGLRASASHAFGIDSAWAADAQAFDIDPARATAPGPLYRFPFRALALATLAANLLGLARHFMALAEPVVQARTTRRGDAGGAVLAGVQAQHQALTQARTAFYAALDDAWRRLDAGQPLEAGAAGPLEAESFRLARTTRELFAAAYPACGLLAADPRSELNRVWRDFHTATQHALWMG